MWKGVSALFIGGLISKIVGLVREIAVAATLGTTSHAAAFRISQTFALMPGSLLLSDGVTNAFVPLYTRLNLESPVSARCLLWFVCIALGLVSATTAISIYLLADAVVLAVASQLEESTRQSTVAFLRVLVMGVPVYVLGNVFAFAELSHKRYFWMSVRPAIQSVGVIGGCVAAYLAREPLFIAFGFLTACHVFFFFSWNGARKHGLLARPSRVAEDWKRAIVPFWSAVKPMLAVPIFLQGTLAVERITAAGLGVVAVSALDYAKTITDSVLFLLAVPFGLVALARHGELSDSERSESLGKVVLVLAAASIPISAFLVSHSNVVVDLIFRRGAFDEPSSSATTLILTSSAFGLWAHVIGYVLLKNLYASRKVAAAVTCICISLVVYAGLVMGFADSLGAVALGLGISGYGLVLFLICAYANGVLRQIRFQILCVLAGAAGYFAIDRVLWAGSPDVGLMPALLVWGGFWLAFLCAVPTLRRGLTGAFGEWRRAADAR